MSQPMSENAVEFLRQQHDAARQLLEAVATTTGEARRQVFESLVRLLAVHETAEEMVVYPVVRAAADEGNRIADARLAEEDRAKKLLSDLEQLDPGSKEFDELFIEVRSAVEEHADNEEQEVFPLLASTADEGQLRVIGSGLKLAERIAPTHPHRAAPESATGNLMVGPLVSMVDRVRDAMRDATR